MSDAALYGVRDAVVVTGSAQPLGKVARGFYCGTSGDLVVTLEDGTSVTFTGIGAGVVHPIRFHTITSFSGANGLACY